MQEASVWRYNIAFVFRVAPVLIYLQQLDFFPFVHITLPRPFILQCTQPI